VVIGLAVGSAFMVVPLCIGEAAPSRIRGALVSFNQLAITSGILASSLVDYGLASTQNWRLMFGLAAIPAVLMFVGIWFQHESPHWLVTQGREDEARAVLERVRDDSDIDAEIAGVRELSKRKSTARDLLNPKIRHALTIGIRIVVGIDSSDGSLAALTCALREARLRGATLHVVLGWGYHPSWGGAGAGLGSMFPLGYTAWAADSEGALAARASLPSRPVTPRRTSRPTRPHWPPGSWTRRSATPTNMTRAAPSSL